MSYHRKATLALPMGDVTSVISAAGSVASDPYFNEAVCRVQQLAAINNHKPVPTCTVTPANQPGGVGLRVAMPPLRAYVYASRQPYRWPLYAAVAGVIGLPMLLGYAIGRHR